MGTEALTEYLKNKNRGINLIAAERTEQIEKHSWTIFHDKDRNTGQQLVIAAWKLISLDSKDRIDNPPLDWDVHYWNKMASKPRKERLIIAGALIAAELDRINL